MAAVCPFPMTVSSPTDGASVQSPVQVVATAQSATPIYNTRVYVDGQAVFFTFFGNLNTMIWVPNGVHTLEIVSQDQAGFVTTKQLQLNVTGQNPGISNIQNMPGWINCSSILATGAVCAAGLGTHCEWRNIRAGQPPGRHAPLFEGPVLESAWRRIQREPLHA